MPYIIAEPCIDVQNKACVAACPVDYIDEGPAQLFIHPDGDPSSRSEPGGPGTSGRGRRKAL
jgi:NAD-dependent dihydropyrimidine dehydrogenase PreA subunit